MWVKYWLKAPATSSGANIMVEEWVWFGDDLESPKNDDYLAGALEDWLNDQLPGEKFIENAPAGWERVARLPHKVAADLLARETSAMERHIQMIMNIVPHLENGVTK